ERGVINGETPRKIYALDDLFAIAEVVFYPSTSEGFGREIIRSARAGLPVFVYPYHVFQDELQDLGIAQERTFPVVTTHPADFSARRRLFDRRNVDQEFRELMAEVEDLIGDEDKRQKIGQEKRRKAERYFSLEQLKRQIRYAVEKAITLHAIEYDVVQKFSPAEEEKLLGLLPALNEAITYFSNQVRLGDDETSRERAREISIALRVLRRERYIPAVQKAFDELSKNLLCELPRQRRLMQAVARVTGLDQEYRPRDYMPIPMLRDIHRRRLWADVVKDHRVVEMLIREYDWFKKYLAEHEPDTHKPRIIYFSKEFGFKTVKNYSGGLGILAGDHARGVSDAKLNFGAVGLLYEAGYFFQIVDKDGNQIRRDEEINFKDLPLLEAGPKTAKYPEGTPVVIDLPYEGRVLKAKVWKMLYGNTPIYLLDANIEENPEEYRVITKRLYDSSLGTKERLMQYYVKGAGGIIALRKLQELGIEPTYDIVHLNDNHPVFAPMQMVKFTIDELKAQRDIPDEEAFEAALAMVRAKTVFTTHTPVLAGNESEAYNAATGERPMLDFIKQIFGGNSYAVERMYGLGFHEAHGGAFNLTVFLLNTAGHRNAVSKLHGHTARKMWQRLFPGVSLDEVPISHIVNSVHSPYWMASEIEDLFTKVFGDHELRDLVLRWHRALEGKEKDEAAEEMKKHFADPEWRTRHIPVDRRQLWRIHQHLKQEALDEIRRRTQERHARGDATDRDLEDAMSLNRDTLTFGFFRRFAEYKRALLLLEDEDDRGGMGRIYRLIEKAKRYQRPIQLVIGGKAHPRDTRAIPMIKRLIEYQKKVQALNTPWLKIVFVENYNIELARYLESGMDIWLNSPRRPLEASGTSGEKAGMNGVLNLSSKDGWEVEGIVDGWNGFLFGVDTEDGNDFADAEALYHTLDTVLELYDPQGNEEWIDKMIHSIITTFFAFGMERFIQDYDRQLYQSAWTSSQEMTVERALQVARERLALRKRLESNRGNERPDVIKVEYPRYAAVGEEMEVKVEVDFKRTHIDDYAVDVILEPDIKTKSFPLGRRTGTVQHLGDSRYQLTFRIPVADEGYYKLVVRVMPLDAIAWKTDGRGVYELHAPNQEIVRYWDSEKNNSQIPKIRGSYRQLLDFRIQAVNNRNEPISQGMLLYIHVPEAAKVNDVKFASAQTNFRQNAISMTHVPGTDIWAVVVPEGYDLQAGFGFVIDVDGYVDKMGRPGRWSTGHYPPNAPGGATIHIDPQDPLFSITKALEVLEQLVSPSEELEAEVAQPLTDPLIPTYAITSADAHTLLRQAMGERESFYFAQRRDDPEGYSSTPGFLGLVEACRKLRNETPEKFNAMLLYHAANGDDSGDRKGGDFFYVVRTAFLQALEGLPQLKRKAGQLARSVQKAVRPGTKLENSLRLVQMMDTLARDVAWRIYSDFVQGDPVAREFVENDRYRRLLLENLILRLDEAVSSGRAVKIPTRDTEAHIRSYAV
ncbi:MAG: alpha-glucan family phosphorylase, partial [Candidatus Omnitrophica bacterium]|nr:alpha-glucan family phosphorylase [Candidatus Omnitrophota bacterium]